MNKLDMAIEDTVHGYAGGTSELSDHMGMNRTILNNKACHTNEHHQFHPNQLMTLQKVTNNWSITDAFVAARDQFKEVVEKEISDSIWGITQDFAAVVQQVSEAMADNKLTERERRQCLNVVEDLIGDCEALKHSIHREGLEQSIKAVK